MSAPGPPSSTTRTVRTTGQARAHSQLRPCTGGRGPRWPAERESRQTTDSSAGRSSPPTGPQRRLSRRAWRGGFPDPAPPASRSARASRHSPRQSCSRDANRAACRPPECARHRGSARRSGPFRSVRPHDPSPGRHAPPTPPADSKSQPPAPADPPQTPAHAQPPPTRPHAPPPRIAAQPNPPATTRRFYSPPPAPRSW